ncbi:MAG TPA: polyprenyl synthetase family protein, partial [Candidatus Eisenbacteria bacterium]|nr:polyprenyl synthetase family protein [Candidatus Eisenbacteria bacterium]
MNPTPVARPALNDIYAPIESDLAQFSELLKKELRSEDALISEIHGHLLKMTGKFLRPALTVLCSRVNGSGSPCEPAVRLAVAIELIHTATLVHDDIIDDSELRRNQPSVYYKWGREISIVSGDYLYAKAFVMLASLKDVWVNQAFAACAHVICEGEMKQIEKRKNFLIDEREYLKIIHQKTAALFQAACMGGAYFSGADPATIEKLGDYGYRLGMAFQIVDDCLDLTGETESLGKTAGLDVYKNDVTLPLLYLFRDLPEAERASLLAGAGGNGNGHSNGNGAGSPLARIRDLAKRHRSVEKAMEKAR